MVQQVQVIEAKEGAPGTPGTSNEKVLWSAAEVQHALSIGPYKFRELRREGLLNAIRIGPGTVRYKRADVIALVDRLIDERTSTTTAGAGPNLGLERGE